MRDNRQLLLEDKRSELLSQSKSGANYVPWNQHYGKNRYQRRLKSKIAPSIKHFNNIDMNKFFKTDILDVLIDVKGETNIYKVRMSFVGTLDEIHNELKKSGATQIDRKIVLRALTKAFNNDDVYINCTCPDFRYRFKYWATKKNLLIGDPEHRPANITNPHDDKGPGCKHIILCLSDASWLIKIASVIYNYVYYMEKHEERLFQRYIFPAVYGKPYDEYQMSIWDEDEEELASGEEDIATANRAARERGRWKKGNEYRFRKEEPGDSGQMSFDDLENELGEEPE